MRIEIEFINAENNPTHKQIFAEIITRHVSLQVGRGTTSDRLYDDKGVFIGMWKVTED